ncbi:Protein bric-a-brac 1, partial [Cyphomyrmex costatus]
REGGRREYGEPEANATVAGSVEEEFAAAPGPRMLQQRGCIATATTPVLATTTGSASSSSSNMFPQQYCLRWKYHHSNLQTMFSQLLERQAYCDVTLACEGKTLRAHKPPPPPPPSPPSPFTLGGVQIVKSILPPKFRMLPTPADAVAVDAAGGTTRGLFSFLSPVGACRDSSPNSQCSFASRPLFPLPAKADRLTGRLPLRLRRCRAGCCQSLR